jgi:dTDP-glucose 4,6-dehydratase
MRLLVTGGCGFIGSHFIKRVIDEPKVELVVNADCLTYAGNLNNVREFQQNSKYKFLRVDLRHKAAIGSLVDHEEITHVVHLAAESHVDRSISGPDAFMHSNFIGTFNLLEACRKLWGTKEGHVFVHVSTDEVYGSLPEPETFNETMRYAPSSPYSASKAASDMLLSAYVKTYGFPGIVTNCSNNYGPRQFPEKLIPTTIEHVRNNDFIPIHGNGKNVRDWIYVEDHVEALWMILNSGKIGESYCIGGNKCLTNLSVVQTICDTMDKLDPASFNNSRRWIKHVEDRPGNDLRYAIDASKISGELGWYPKIKFEEGIIRTIESHLKS